MIGADRLDAQYQLAVVEQQPRAGFERLEDFPVGQLDAVNVAGK